MIPMFLPNHVLDDHDSSSTPALSMMAAKGREHLRALRDRAIAEGAHVLLVIWPSLEWVLLAVEPPEDVVIEDSAQLIPSLLANPKALELMRTQSLEGNHLSWLVLTRPVAILH